MANQSAALVEKALLAFAFSTNRIFLSGSSNSYSGSGVYSDPVRLERLRNPVDDRASILLHRISRILEILGGVR